MTYVLPSVLLALAAAALGVWWWRRRKSDEPTHRMISLVALLREPVLMDPAVIASTAGRAWQVDLGDGAIEGEDGFVVCTGPINSIVCQNRPYLINAFPRPYVDDPESAAESIVDMRTRSLFAAHQAWFSCDALGLGDSPDEAEVADAYRQLARLLVEFLDENWLLIYCPDTSRAYPIGEGTEAALLSDDPLAALDETMPAMMVAVSDDDPLLLKAVAEAQEKWPQFVTAFENRAGDEFAVKAPVSYEGNCEYIWVKVTALEGERIYGTLENDPANLGPLKFGSKVTVELAKLNDWCYLDSEGNPHGMFSVAAMQAAAQRQRDIK